MWDCGLISLYSILSFFFMSYGGWFVLNIAVGMLQFYSGRSILLITRLNNSLGLFTICDKRQLGRKATCSLVTLKPIYHNNPAKGWLKKCVLGKIQILNLIKKNTILNLEPISCVWSLKVIVLPMKTIKISLSHLSSKIYCCTISEISKKFKCAEGHGLKFFFLKESTVSTGT